MPAPAPAPPQPPLEPGSGTGHDPPHALWPVLPLLAGVGILMGATGLQGSLVALRATSEGFGTALTGVIASSYFAGFLVGARLGARWIQRVGHVRAFAALASMASTLVLLHVLAVVPPVWIAARFATGVCVSGLVVIIESWLNRAAPTASRGRTMSAYMMVTVGGYGLGQLLLVLAPVDGFELFAVVSLLMSWSLVPIILSRRSSAEVVVVAPLPLRDLLRRVPTAAVASLIAGLTWGAIAGWAAVVAVDLGLAGLQVSLFVSAFLLGHLLMEPVVGRLSDRLDRNVVVVLLGAAAVAASATALVLVAVLPAALTLVGVAVGGTSLPLYSVSIASAGDRLHPDEMVAAAGTLVRINGIGAASGPLLASLASSLTAGGLYLVVGGGMAVSGAVAAAYLVRSEQRPPLVPYVRLVARGTSAASRQVLGRAAIRRRRGRP